MDGPADKHPQRFVDEPVTPADIYRHAVSRVLIDEHTAFQHMRIVESPDYGLALVLDDRWQISAVDEAHYHEPLVHPACIVHGGPKRVLILGGGDGVALREVLRWRTVQRAVLVDIDGEVVQACRTHLGPIHQGAFDDARAEVVIEDAFEYLARVEHGFDVIISDLSDPIEAGPSAWLFTREAFERMAAALAPGGVLVLQAGAVSHPEAALHARVVSTLRAVLPHVTTCYSMVPTWACPMGYALARREAPIPNWFTPAEVDRLIEQQTTGRMRMLDGRVMCSLFQSPLWLRELVAAERRVFTLADLPRTHTQDQGLG